MVVMENGAAKKVIYKNGLNKVLIVWSLVRVGSTINLYHLKAKRDHGEMHVIRITKEYDKSNI